MENLILRPIERDRGMPEDLAKYIEDAKKRYFSETSSSKKPIVGAEKVSGRLENLPQVAEQTGRNAVQQIEKATTPTELLESIRPKGIEPVVNKESQKVSLLPSIAKDNDLVKQLNKALREAKPIQGLQEELYTKARGQKLAKLISAREKMAGEKGFYDELGALKGELPKVNYEPIRKEFTQENVDRLFNMVKKSNRLTEWDKINAQVGLSKLLGEKGLGVPTRGEIEKMYQVFGKDFTETLLSMRPFMEKVKEGVMQLYNLPRSMMAGVGDLSGTMMQNLMFAYRHPIITGKNFFEQLKYFANEGYYKMAMDEIYQRPTAELYKKMGISFTDIGPIARQREEAFMSSWAEKIPGLGRVIRATGRAYTGFLNKMRADVADLLIDSQKQLGLNVNDTRFLKSAGKLVNAGSGRGDLGQLEKIAPLLGQGLFSARKLAAVVNMLDPRFYLEATPLVRKEALKTWLAFLAGAGSLRFSFRLFQCSRRMYPLFKFRHNFLLFSLLWTNCPFNFILLSLSLSLVKRVNFSENDRRERDPSTRFARSG